MRGDSEARGLVCRSLNKVGGGLPVESQTLQFSQLFTQEGWGEGGEGGCEGICVAVFGARGGCEGICVAILRRGEDTRAFVWQFEG